MFARIPVAVFVLVSCGFIASSAGAAPVSHKCGSTINRVVKTDSPAFQTSATTPQPVPGAGITVDVPDGEKRCVIVRFSGAASCSATASADICTIMVAEPGVAALDPPVNGLDFNDENPNVAAHSFEWVRVLGPGSHPIKVLADGRGCRIVDALIVTIPEENTP